MLEDSSTKNTMSALALPQADKTQNDEILHDVNIYKLYTHFIILSC